MTSTIDAAAVEGALRGGVGGRASDVLVRGPLTSAFDDVADPHDGCRLCAGVVILPCTLLQERCGRELDRVVMLLLPDFIAFIALMVFIGAMGVALQVAA